jgi:hypothetical protein
MRRLLAGLHLTAMIGIWLVAWLPLAAFYSVVLGLDSLRGARGAIA